MAKRSEHLKVLLSDLTNKVQNANANSINMDYATQGLDTNIGTFQMASNSSVDGAKKYLSETGYLNEDRNWWQKWNDLGQTVEYDVIKGLYNFADDIFDLLVITSGEIGGAFGADKQWAQNLSNNDNWVTYATEGTNVVRRFVSGEGFTKEYWDTWESAQRLEYEQAKRAQIWKNAVGDQGGEFVSGLAQNLGYMIPSLAVGGKFGGKASLGTTGVGAFAGTTSEAYNETGDLGKSSLAGLASAGVEVASELVVGKVLDVAGLGTGKIAGMFKNGKTPLKTTSFIKDLAKTMFEEGVEEAFSAVTQPFVESIYKGEEALYTEDGTFKLLDTDFWFNGSDSVIAQAGSGAVLGGILGGASLTQQYQMLGKEGVNIQYLLEKNQDLNKKLAKYKKTDPKYKEILEEISANTTEILALTEQLKKKGNSEQIKNVAMLMGAPTQFIEKFNKETEKQDKAFDKAVSRRVEQFENNERFTTVNLFNELESKFGTGYRLRFARMKGDVNSKVNHSRKEILINERLEKNISPILAHEYLGHVIGDNMDAKMRQKIFDKVVETEWYKQNVGKLYNAYQKNNKDYQKLDEPSKKKYWQTEVVNKYVEDVLTQSTSAKSTKVVTDTFLGTSFLDKINNFFSKSKGNKMLKNRSIFSEFKKGINKIMKLLDAKVARALRHHIVGQELDDKEKKIYKKYKDLFDYLKGTQQANEVYSIQIQGKKYDIEKDLYEYTKKFEKELDNIEYVEKIVDDIETDYVNKKYITRINKMAMETKDYLESVYDPENFDVELNDLDSTTLESIQRLSDDLLEGVDSAIYAIENCDWDAVNEDDPNYDNLKELSEYFNQVNNYIEDHIDEVQEKELEEEEKASYNENTNEGDVEDEFRRIQEESRGVSSEEQQLFHSQSKEIDETLRNRLSRTFRKILRARSSVSSNGYGLLENTGDFKIYSNVEGDIFHDIFEIVKVYLPNGELVDLHDNYDDSICYLSEDGLSGFAITKNGDVISVFNLSDKRGWLRSITNEIKTKGKTLDCYASPNQPLNKMYEKTFGFQTASIMDYNMEYDHDDIAKNHNEPKVAFMVNTTEKVETKEFDKDSYDEAQAYQQSYVEKKNAVEKVEEQKVVEKEKTETKTETEKESEKQTPSEVKQVEEEPKTKKKKAKPLDENLKPLETNMAKEVKESAEEKEGRVISLTAVEDIFDVLEVTLSNISGFEMKIQNKDSKARRLFEDFNLLKNSAKKENCRKFVDDLFQIEIDDTHTYEDYLNALFVPVTEEKQNFVNLLYDLLNDSSRDSQTTQKINKLNNLINRLQTAFNEHKATITFIKTLNTIRNNLLKETKKIGNTGQLDLTSGYKAMYASFFAQFRYTKNDYVSMSNLTRLAEMVENGSFDKFIDAILYQSKEVNNLGELTTIAENIKQLARDLVDSKVDGQTHMNYEQTMAFVNLNKAIYHLYKEQKKGVMEEARDDAKVLIKRAKEVAKRLKQTGAGNFILEKVLDTVAPREIIAYMCGGSDTEEFKMIYEKLYRDPYLKQISKQTDFLLKRDKLIGTIRKLQNQKLTINGVKMKKYVLYQFYLNTLSPDNVERMQKGGIEYTDKTSKSLDYQAMQEAVNNRLSEKEKADLDALFKFYNEDLKDYVETISEKLYGFKVSRNNYYPIVGSEAFKIQDLAGGQQMKYSINAMENGRLKKLSNRRTVIELNINPIQLSNDYIESMTITGEIGEASQKLNRLFQLKDENGESFASVVSQYVPNAQTYIKSIFSKLVGTINTVERNALLDKIVGRWATATLGFKVRSMLKQFGSFFTAWAKVGLKVGVKALFSPKYLKEFNKDHIDTRLKENPVFKQRIYNNDYIRGMSLSAGAQEFASTFTRKLVNFTMKGMELLDRLTCYATYTLAQAQVEASTNLKRGTDKYYDAVDSLWTDIILETQSNANRIAMSRIRSGEKGWVAKNMFGLFQADSQNKASQLFTVVNDTNQLKLEIKELKEKLKTANDTEKAEIQKKIDNLQEKLKNANMRARAYGASLLASAVWVALADMLADWLYDKEEPEDETFIEFIGEVVSNATIEWIPYFSTFYNWIKYDGAELSALEPINEIIDVIKRFSDGEVSRQDYVNAVIKLAKFFGIPIENINSFIEGVISNYNPELAVQYKSIYYNMSQSYLTKNTNEQFEKGNYDKAKGFMSMDYTLYKFEADSSVLGEILNLRKSGENVSIRNVPSSYEDENGVEIELTETQVQEFKNTYNLANASINKLMADPNYQSLSSSEKAKVVKKIADAYYEYALYKSTGKIPTTRLGQLLTKTGGNINLELMTLLTIKLQNVTGTNRKTELVNQLNKIKGLSRNEKLLVMKLMGYSVNEENKQGLVTYLVNNGFTKEEAESWV